MWSTDDRSTIRGTSRLIRGAQVITEQRSRVDPAVQTAVQTAFQAVEADYDIVVDGDNTYPINVATEMLRLLQTNDVVIGSGLKGTMEPGTVTKLNVVKNVLLSFAARALVGAHISDARNRHGTAA
jgi:hypothetical protein